MNTIKTMLKSYSLPIAISGVLFSCATPQTVQHNSAKGTINLFSQTDVASNDKRIQSDAVTAGVIDKLKAKLKENPKDIEAALTLSNIYIALSNSKESIRYAKQALRFNLKEHRARLLLAQNYYRTGKYKLAEVILSALPPEHLDSADVYNIRALIAYKRGKKGDSWQLFKLGSEKFPNHVALNMNFGVLLLKYRQSNLAKIHFERVVNLVPDHNDALVHLAIIDAIQGNVDSAEDALESLTSSDNRLNKFNIGVIAFIRGDYAAAEINLKRFIADKSATKESVESAAILIERIGEKRAELAEKKFEKARDKKNSTPSQGQAPEKDETIDELENELLK